MNNMNNEALKKFLYESEIIQLPSQEEYAIGLVSNFLNRYQESKPNIQSPRDLCNFIDEEIAKSQEEIGFYLNQILHSSNFQNLEGAWRSIHDLVQNSELGPDLKIRLMDIQREELISDIERAPDFDQSFIFKKIYEDNFGTPGGEPISCLIFDYYFTKSQQDVKLMCDLSNILSAAHVQTIAGVHQSVFDLREFSNLGDPIDLRSIFDSPELSNWNSFRQREEARYITLTLPRVLKRLPYNNSDNPIKSISFIEEVSPNSAGDFCWGNAAYAMGQCITRAFTLYEWVAAIRGVESGGKVESMPIYVYKTATGETLQLCPTETAITDRREKELSDLGFLSLCYFKKTDYSVFLGCQTAIKPELYDSDYATANASLSSSLPFMLIVSRFAHYMKCMLRDYIGSNLSKEDIRKYLQGWIARYVTLNENATNEIKLKYPLKAASIQVEEKPGSPGHYYAIVRITPHFQLESINISTRLVVNLPTKS